MGLFGVTGEGGPPSWQVGRGAAGIWVAGPVVRKQKGECSFSAHFLCTQDPSHGMVSSAVKTGLPVSVT